MSDVEIRLSPFLIVFLVFLGAAIAFSLYWDISTHIIWAARVRRLLEQEGFTVRQMERRWFTKGPFKDMRTPGTKHHRECLVRVEAVDREHRPRSGWARWGRKRPWEAADRWAVQWDAPGPGPMGGAPAARKRGLSTAVFMALILPPSLAGAGMGTYLLVRGYQEQMRNPLASRQTAGASTPASGTPTAAVYEIRCRGGGDSYRREQLSAGPRTERGTEIWRVQLSLKFQASAVAAGSNAEGLTPGTCAWIDRPLNHLEPREIRFETVALKTGPQPSDLRPMPGMFPTDEDLRDPARYWSFFVFNTNQGFLQATSQQRWTPPAAPVPAPTPEPPPAAAGEIAQRFVCERSYTNYAWGYQHAGIYVDREGVVYQFKVQVTGYPKLPQGPDLTELEMENKYGPDTKPRRTVPASELRAMYVLIPTAAKGKLSKKVSAARDLGALVSSCYLFDPETKRYRGVELEVSGDWEYRNLAPEARKLAAWLASLDRPIDKK